MGKKGYVLPVCALVLVVSLIVLCVSTRRGFMTQFKDGTHVVVWKECPHCDRFKQKAQEQGYNPTAVHERGSQFDKEHKDKINGYPAAIVIENNKAKAIDPWSLLNQN
ncbi:MAG: hypothetical protein CMM25_02795 [Rhodospirillaceae bacterium]|nr:hypothetical protein [Rhodospirillaceae bacterium]